MKKCKGCKQEIDKYAIACEYCGKLNEEREHPQPPQNSGPKSKEKSK